jgi:hypothetical protein
MSGLIPVTGSRAVRVADILLLDLYEGLRVVRPDPKSKAQMKAAKEFGAAINRYESTKDEYATALRKTREENKELDEKFFGVEKDPNYDFYPGEREDDMKFFGLITIRHVNLAWNPRVQAAIQLRECVVNALALGILRSGDDLLLKLDRCQATNRKLNKMLAEAGKERIQPLKQDDAKGE